MPNWCANRVTVYGQPNEIKLFKDFVKREEQLFSFDAIMPVPPVLHEVQSPVTIVDTEAEVEAYIEEHKHHGSFVCGHPITKDTQDRLLKEYDYDNWYDWSCSNWGTKWDARDVTLVDYWEDGELTYTFDTAWGPPEGIHSMLITKFPTLSISWFWDEPGMQLAGYLT